MAEMQHDFHFGISPNPVVDGRFKLTYLLPQNKAGRLDIYSLTGQRIYTQTLPPWSTLQFIQLPEIASGIYTAVISSGNERAIAKLAVMK